MKILHLASMILTVTLLASPMLVGLTSSAGVYNPWYDLDDDGDIDIFDVVKMAGIYGTSGEPYEAKAVLAYDSGWINITDKCGQSFSIIHNLNSMDVMVDIQGKATSNGGVHERHLGGTGYTPGWSKTYGGNSTAESVSDLVQTSDGGFAIVGSTWAYDESGDCWLVKTDADGDAQWSKTYGGPTNDYGKSLVQTSDGGYAIAGTTNSPSGGPWDILLVKTDALGNVQWNQKYGESGSDLAASVVQTSDGGYAIAGCTLSFGASLDAYLVKTNATGSLQWSRVYGGTGTERADSVVQTDDGGYALAITTDSYGAGGDDFWLVKTDSSGMMQWNQTYGGVGQEIANRAVQTVDGGYALAGTRSGDFHLVKTDSNGNAQWNRTYAYAAYAHASDLIQTSDGGYAITGSGGVYGYEYESFLLVKTDASGNVQWNKIYETTITVDPVVWSSFVVQTSDGGYAIAGTPGGATVSGDFWLIKTEVESGLAWTDSTADTITLYRGATDPYWNFVRVRIWKIKEP